MHQILQLGKYNRRRIVIISVLMYGACTWHLLVAMVETRIINQSLPNLVCSCYILLIFMRCSGPQFILLRFKGYHCKYSVNTIHCQDYLCICTSSNRAANVGTSVFQQLRCVSDVTLSTDGTKCIFISADGSAYMAAYSTWHARKSMKKSQNKVSVLFAV